MGWSQIFQRLLLSGLSLLSQDVQWSYAVVSHCCDTQQAAPACDSELTVLMEPRVSSGNTKCAEWVQCTRPCVSECKLVGCALATSLWDGMATGWLSHAEKARVWFHAFLAQERQEHIPCCSSCCWNCFCSHKHQRSGKVVLLFPQGSRWDADSSNVIV